MLEDWRRSSVFDNVFTGNMYIGIFSCRGTPILNEPVSQYSRWVNLSKTDDNDRTHGNNANALS